MSAGVASRIRSFWLSPPPPTAAATAISPDVPPSPGTVL